MRAILYIFIVLFFGVFFVTPVLASDTNGAIDSTYKYAWGENLGWINFGCDDCGVLITDSAITGYAWSSKFGWINLNPDNGGVLNDAEGNLSGFAWGSNVGWINFTGVTIDENGEFSGYATVDTDSSEINFNCLNGNSCATADFKIKTDWRPASTRVIDVPDDSNNSGGSGTSGSRPSVLASIVNPVVNVIDRVTDFVLDFFGPNKPENTVVVVPVVTPPAFTTRWNLLPVESISSFVFAPLPYEIRILAGQFPELDKTLKAVQVERLSDLSKLTGVTLNVPGLADILNKTITNFSIEELKQLGNIQNINSIGLNAPGFSNDNLIKPGDLSVSKISLVHGLPVAQFSLAAKENLPTEFVFARGGGELVDLNVAISVSDRGEVSQKLSSLPGQVLKLVVKPISKARSVTGYIVFNSATPKVTEKNTNSILRSSLTASALFSMDDLVEKVPDTLPPFETKFVLSSFEYLDADHDGIYTADVVTPSVPGEYEIVTIVDYIDPVLGSRKMSLVTVVDPEGYVFEKNDGKETRIPSAVVSIYKLDAVSQQPVLWTAKDYSQVNPQVTDIRGTYSFLVPAGSYYLKVEAPGYKPYQGEVFVVAEGNGIHQNIELKPSGGWWADIDWQNILLVVVLLLLVYNLYRNSVRDRLLNLSK